MSSKGIDIMLNNVMLEKAIMKIYPDLEYEIMKPILNAIVFTKTELTIDEAKNLYKKHIPKIYDLIDWDLYYEYCVINDYLKRFEEETGLYGSDLLDKLSNNKIAWSDMRVLLNTLKENNYKYFVQLFKEHFSKKMIEENSLETHTKYVEREKKLKRILSLVEDEDEI